MSSICKARKTHYSSCIYKNCGINSRENILNVRFYRLPVEDRDRLITWLVNSGCDDFAEESDTELRKFSICSRHFSPNMIYPSGRLKKMQNHYYILLILTMRNLLTRMYSVTSIMLKYAF